MAVRCLHDRPREDVAVITLEGELDLVTADVLRRALAQERTRGALTDLVIDLSQVTFIDSSGLGVLVGAQRLAERPLHVVAADGMVRRALTLSNLHKIFVLTDTRAQALAALGLNGGE